MIIIALVVLFSLQLISFFIIILLNSKISKFKDLEVRQDQLIREMDDVIGVYLLEMREENDRLIQELKDSKQQVTPFKQPVMEFEKQPVQKPLVVEEPSFTESPQVPQPSVQPVFEQRPFMSKNMAASAYNRQKESTSADVASSRNRTVVVEKEQQPIVQTLEQQVVQYFNDGMTIEEIAKKTQKGKTEIELLIKFHA